MPTGYCAGTKKNTSVRVLVRVRGPKGSGKVRVRGPRGAGSAQGAGTSQVWVPGGNGTARVRMEIPVLCLAATLGAALLTTQVLVCWWLCSFSFLLCLNFVLFWLGLARVRLSACSPLGISPRGDERIRMPYEGHLRLFFCARPPLSRRRSAK